jgi:uncharacterized membrane protein
MPSVDQLLFALTLVAALGSGLVAGFFFAFSSTVMGALAQRPAAQGMAAMQSINVVVLRSSFIATFLGTGVVCVVAFIVSLLRWHEPGAAWLVSGSLLYLVGSLWVTIAFNVPRNEALKRFAPADLAGQTYWADYLVTWTIWNHVRTVASLAAAAAFTIALCKQ